jgi:hypothetical protein
MKGRLISAASSLRQAQRNRRRYPASGMPQPYGEKFTLDLVEIGQFGNLVS